MIICDTYRFVFLHIPKCGGSSVRRALRKYDDASQPFAMVRKHPVLGEIDYMHLPLCVLRDHFPEEFDKIRRFSSFALVREPRERFLSAVAQYSRQYLGKEISGITAKEILDECHNACDYLSSSGFFADPKRIHFERQSHFVDLDGTRVIKFVMPLSRIDDMINAIGELAHDTIKLKEPRNRTLTHRLHASETITGNIDAVFDSFHRSKLIPSGLKRVARNIIYQPIDYSPVTSMLPEEVSAFIDSYYKEDKRILEEALANPLPTIIAPDWQRCN